ncbi:MAG: IMP dehydrogenase [Sulfolobales archaeon]
MGYGLSLDDVLLVPSYSDLNSRSEVSLRTRFSRRIWINIPLVSAAMDSVTESRMAIAMARMGGIGVIHRFMPIDRQVEEVKRVKEQPVGLSSNESLGLDGRLAVAAAVGVRGDYLERAERLYRSGVDAIVIDVAHAHSKPVFEAVRNIKKVISDSVDIVVGNIATGEAARDLIELDVDGIKVGIGPGHVCITRIVAGVGVPQLTAIMNVYSVAKPYGVPIIADGGMRSSGDIVKALAAGASSAMIGYLLAGTEEAPGKPVMIDGRKYKLYRGMASNSSYLQRVSIDNQDPEDLSSYAAEGIEMLVPYRGVVAEVVSNIVSGLRSGFSYVGARNIEELWERARFVILAPGAHRESYHRDHGVRLG